MNDWYWMFSERLLFFNKFSALKQWYFSRVKRYLDAYR